MIPFDPVAENDERAMELASLLSGAYLSMGDSDRSQELSQRMLAAAESTGDEVIATLHTVILAGVGYVQGTGLGAVTCCGAPWNGPRAIGPSALMMRPAIVVARA